MARRLSIVAGGGGVEGGSGKSVAALMNIHQSNGAIWTNDNKRPLQAVAEWRQFAAEIVNQMLLERFLNRGLSRFTTCAQIPRSVSVSMCVCSCACTCVRVRWLAEACQRGRQRLETQ